MGFRLVLFTSIAAGIAFSIGPGGPIVAAARAAEPEKAPTYKTDIQPILAANCVNCHNPKKSKGRVELQSMAGLMRTVKVGQPDQSKLYKSLLGKGAKQMPPKKSLTEVKIGLVKAWIASGAK